MIKVGIVGATGYAGAELVRLLQGHPEASITHLVSESMAGSQMESVYPSLMGVYCNQTESLNAELLGLECDIVFTALPHHVSAKAVPAIAAAGARVIDLSGDFRYDDPAVYEQWYGQSHPYPDLMREAVYGMPELPGKRAAIAAASIVGNPGCYTTCSILALAPALSSGLIETKGIVIDAKSGVTGAGRKATQDLHFCEVQDNFKAYKIASHRHTSEIEQELSKVAGEPITLTFTPHLLPVKRGILATIYGQLNADVTATQVLDAYRAFYTDQPFIVIHAPGSYPELKFVNGSNFLHIGAEVDRRTGRLILIACLDNLIKGAAGQAIQNMNLMFGLNETTGLKAPAYYL
jgi:N-acetyl-gamma-glutamyl-phosphate reductase